MTVAEAAKELGHKYTSRTYDLIKKGILKSKETKEGVMVDKASLEAYMKKRDERGQEKAKPKAAAKAKGKSAQKKTASSVRAQPKPSQKKKLEAAMAAA